MSKCHKKAKLALLIDSSAKVQTFSKPGQSVEDLFNCSKFQIINTFSGNINSRCKHIKYLLQVKHVL